MTEKRYFSREQKRALYILAGGKCQDCGEPLQDEWHADHIEPFSKGGATDVINGQALCPKCNQKKGDRTEMVLSHWPKDFQLRPWQVEARRRYFALNKPNFLLVATPGAGKTIGSLSIAYQSLLEGGIKRLVIVCPTDHLRTQWIDDATRVEIHLDKLNIGWGNEIILTNDFIGIVTTYQQVLFQKELLRKFVNDAPTLVIFDEIHHCGDSGDSEKLKWGSAVDHAFGPARRRLLISGTPFRTDNSRIPFISYEKDGDGYRCVADYTFSYGDALKQENPIVRDIVFPAWDGGFVWEYGFEQKEATFQDQLNREDSRNRLRTALDPQGQWLRDVLAAANEKLDYIRNIEGHKDAGGLVTAKDEIHARSIAKLLEKISGEKPVVVTSYDDNASEEIKRYRTSSKKWIIAIKMVSEGVDIKRLRVGVYATNILSQLFFLQVIGRVLRWVDGIEYQTAYFYVPEDEQLIAYTKEIKSIILDWLREDDDTESNGRTNGNNNGPQLYFYEFVKSEGREGNHYYDGDTWTKEQLEEAERIFANSPDLNRLPSHIKAQAVATVIGAKQISANGVDNQEVNSRSNKSTSKFNDRKSLRTRIGKRVGRLKKIIEQNNLRFDGNNPFEAINSVAARRFGYARESTIEQLEAKKDWLDELIKRALNGKWDGSELR